MWPYAGGNWGEHTEYPYHLQFQHGLGDPRLIESGYGPEFGPGAMIRPQQQGYGLGFDHGMSTHQGQGMEPGGKFLSTCKLIRVMLTSTPTMQAWQLMTLTNIADLVVFLASIPTIFKSH